MSSGQNAQRSGGPGQRMLPKPKAKPMPKPTHFLCIPLAGAQLARSWARFRADVTSATGSVPEDAVRPLGTLHLTLGVMSLTPDGDSDGVGRAVQVLKGLRPRAVLARLRASTPSSSASGHGGLSLSLRGLHAMQAAHKTSVLYVAPTDADGLVGRFCDALRQPFCAAGLIEADEQRPLLLHATVVNTIYVRGPRRRERLMLDARDLLRRYDAFVWADNLPVTKLALCRMGAKKTADGGAAYEVEAEMDLGP